ncbi:MAG: aldehyde dehydrogenase family protein [Bdellovibrionales bacterium]
MAKLITKDPYSGKVTGEFEYESPAQAKAKADALMESQKLWRQRPFPERLRLVKEALSYFEQNRELIATDICEQMGRPLHQARGELNGFFERAHHLCAIAETVLRPDRYTDKLGFDRAIEHEPLGLIFVISAWNYPLLITVNSVVPALLAGNTVLLKHSSLTPKIGAHFEKAFGRLGGVQVLSHVIVNHDTTGGIIEESPIAHVVFTGSVAGGRKILAHTSKKFMMPALELGGKDAAYVHADADLQQAVDSIVDGAMFNSGQSCCGIERAYVHRPVYEEFLKRAEKLIRTYKLGDPKDESTSLGPVAQSRSLDEMKRQILEARENGATVLVGGEAEILGQGVFFQPTLICNVTNDLRIMQEENFGPILPVMAVDNLEEALELINDSTYGLTAAIYTRDVDVARRFARDANVGTVFMNRCDYLDPALPWTGVKNSGCGSALSKYGFYHLTRRKSLHFKTKI